MMWAIKAIKRSPKGLSDRKVSESKTREGEEAGDEKSKMGKEKRAQQRKKA